MNKIAKHYLTTGLCALPAFKAQKRPACNWRQYQERRPTELELDGMFTANVDAVCLVCGAVSGNLEVLDFDQAGKVYQQWASTIDPTLLAMLTIERTPSGGFHVWYRLDDSVPGNRKLAMDDAGVLIETRGQGGICLCAPSPDYNLLQGDFDHLPTLTKDDYAALIDSAKVFNVSTQRTNTDMTSVTPSAHSGTRPGDVWNETDHLTDLLLSHGWSLMYTTADGSERWRRPGKDGDGTSATVRVSPESGTVIFHCFSSNAPPFEAGNSYTPFRVYSLLECGGNDKQAAQQLAQLGYGNLHEDLSGISLDAFLERNAPIDRLATTELQTTLHELAPRFYLTRFADKYRPDVELHPVLINGLLRKREIANVIAAPKTGKSWLVLQLALSLAQGREWLGHKTAKSKVLLIDNELHERTMMYRVNAMMDAMQIFPEWGFDGFEYVCLRDESTVSINTGLHAVFEILEGCHADGYDPDVVILDAFYRFLGPNDDENSNPGVTAMYNILDRMAKAANTSFILVHHTSKGYQGSKSVTDIGAGAGAQSRAADTHITLTEHEQTDLLCMEAVTRSFPPVEGCVLCREFPLFRVVEGMQIIRKGAESKSSREKEKPAEMTVDAFVAKYSNPEGLLFSYIKNSLMEIDGLSRRQADLLIDTALQNGQLVRFKKEKQNYLRLPNASDKNT